MSYIAVGLWAVVAVPAVWLGAVWLYDRIHRRKKPYDADPEA